MGVTPVCWALAALDLGDAWSRRLWGPSAPPCGLWAVLVAGVAAPGRRADSSTTSIDGVTQGWCG